MEVSIVAVFLYLVLTDQLSKVPWDTQFSITDRYGLNTSANCKL